MYVSRTALPEAVANVLQVYFVNLNPVSYKGDCPASKDTLDPYNVGQNATCSPSSQQSCQVGDLSGKHGAMQAPNFAAK